MKKLFVLALTTAAVCAATSAFAQQEGSWMMRIRAVDVETSKKSDAVVVGGATVIPSDDIRVANKTIPEVDFSYFFSKNLAAELVLTYPQKMDVNIAASAAGAFKAGTVKVLPPTLTLQYHFLPDAQFRPYVGAGINYTRFSSISLGPLDDVTQTLGGGNTGTNTIDKNSWGGALQLGFDVKVAQNSFINVDVKKVYMKTDLKNSLVGKLSTLKIDPLYVGLGYGFKF